MKKFLLILSLLLISPVCMFSKPAEKEKTLVEQGLSLIALMKEKANSEAYIALFSGSSSDSSLNDKIKELGAVDISKLAAVYCLSCDYADLVVSCFFGIEELGMPDLSTDGLTKGGLSQELWNDMRRKVFFSTPTIWNAYAGTYGLAAVNIISASSNFDTDEIDSDCIYIFTFDDFYPAAVSFQRGEGRSVYASATFILDKNFTNSFENMFQEIGLDVHLEEVKF